MMTERTLHLIGWILFVISAAGFIVSGLRSGDAAALLGSILFLAGCLAFLAPYTRSRVTADPQRDTPAGERC